MKRIIIIFAACLLSWGAAAQFRQIPGDPVDYSRIRLPRDGSSYPVTYTMSFEHHTGEDYFYDMMYYMMTGDKSEAEKDNIGWTDVVFTGELRHTRDISPEMLEKAIQEAFLKTGLNRPLLKTRQEQVKKIKQIIYTNKDFLMDVAGAVMLAVPGLGELSAGASLAINAAGVGLGIMSLAGDKDNAAAGFVDGVSTSMGFYETMQSISELQGAGTVINTEARLWKFGGTALNVASVGLSVHAAGQRDEQKWLNREGASALWQVNSFYNWVNYYLDLYSRQAGKDAWVLLINSASEAAPYMFRNTFCSVTWGLDAKLVKCESMPHRPDRPNYDFEGKYCGILEAVSIYDLSGYSQQFLTKWGNWADDFLLQGKGFKAHGMMGDGEGELSGDAMFFANYCYNDPWQQGAKLYSHKAEASMSGVYHIPVFFELQASGEAEGTLSGSFVHLMWMNKDDFDGVGIARSFGFSAASPDQMYKTILKMETSMDGIVFPKAGNIPAEMVKISEVIDGEKYIYDKETTGADGGVEHKEVPLRDEHGVIDIALPEGEISIDLGTTLAPTFELAPQDRKDWEKIKAKFWNY